MKRDHSNPQPLLLPLSGAGVIMVISALHREAEESAKAGDDYAAQEAYKIIDRLNELQDIDMDVARQAVGSIVSGFRKGRPQG